MANDYKKFLTGLGLALRKARLEQGYTQAAFGKKAGRNQSAIQKLEQGPVPGVPLNVLYEVAEAGGLSLAELFKEAEAYANHSVPERTSSQLLQNLKNMPESRRGSIERILGEIMFLLPSSNDNKLT